MITFILGPGFFWEWRKTNIESGRLDIERARASYELPQKMTPLLLEIITLAQYAPERMAKEADFNAAELFLARVEERKPVIYNFGPPAAPTGLTIQ